MQVMADNGLAEFQTYPTYTYGRFQCICRFKSSLMLSPFYPIYYLYIQALLHAILAQ